jgi:hypothetical protein
VGVSSNIGQPQEIDGINRARREGSNFVNLLGRGDLEAYENNSRSDPAPYGALQMPRALATPVVPSYVDRRYQCNASSIVDEDSWAPDNRQGGMQELKIRLLRREKWLAWLLVCLFLFCWIAGLLIGGSRIEHHYLKPPATDDRLLE